MVYMEKEATIIEDGSWRTTYKDQIVFHRSIDFVELRQPQKAKVGKKGNAAPAASGFAAEFIVDDMELDADCEEEEMDNADLINGSDSEDELARRLPSALPSLEELRVEIAGRIDKKNYSDTVDTDRGVSTTYWRTTQRNAKMAAYCRS